MANLNKTIVDTINLYISADNERARSLSQIDGKVIKIHLKELDRGVILKIKDLSVIELSESENEKDVEIIVSLKVISNYLLGIDKDRMLKNGDLEIKGDAHVASVFQHTLKEIEIDWEEVLSKYTGDTVAHYIGSGVREIFSLGQRMKENLRLDARDYLQDNLQVAVTSEEVNGFMHEVDSIRAHVERLEARLDRLQSSVTNS